MQQRWYDLLDTSRFTQKSGKVVLEFRLMYDGRITDLKVDGNDVGELLGRVPAGEQHLHARIQC